jgi:putative addiction module component (TIGR02574 family)
MTMPLESIEAEALKLTPEERALLADRLVASLSGELLFEEEWHAEVLRRDAAIEAGDVGTVPAEEALARARRASA